MLEIANYMPDILALQEVQKDKYKDIGYFLENTMGYQGRFLGRSLNKREIGKHGICLYWKKEKFDYRSHKDIYFSDLMKQYCSDDIIDHYNLPQVATLIELYHKATGQNLFVCTTHITCEWQSPEKQVSQVLLLLTVLESLVNNSNLVLLGDFNSTPGSSVYDLITTGSLNLLEQNFSIPFPLFRVDSNNDICHNLALSSAYKYFLNEEPRMTNVKPTEEWTLDYIFYSKGLEPVDYLVLPDENILRKEGGGIPNSEFPSDHLPLMTSFVFSTQQN
eukprot:TRINITY_DN14077_c0_g1_i1.p1 TRINITY_DN14077_c0_g1~~TRINITY_DN14077_c0_g1_i1.p1  ORF type:complete len:276 (-),score=30.54 TRINITY_DN14077_c0_g1_i1:59-886(-)